MRVWLLGSAAAFFLVAAWASVDGALKAGNQFSSELGVAAAVALSVVNTAKLHGLVWFYFGSSIAIRVSSMLLAVACAVVTAPTAWAAMTIASKPHLHPFDTIVGWPAGQTDAYNLILTIVILEVWTLISPPLLSSLRDADTRSNGGLWLRGLDRPTTRPRSTRPKG